MKNKKQSSDSYLTEMPHVETPDGSGFDFGFEIFYQKFGKGKKATQAFLNMFSRILSGEEVKSPADGLTIQIAPDEIDVFKNQLEEHPFFTNYLTNLFGLTLEDLFHGSLAIKERQNRDNTHRRDSVLVKLDQHDLKPKQDHNAISHMSRNYKDNKPAWEDVKMKEAKIKELRDVGKGNYFIVYRDKVWRFKSDENLNKTEQSKLRKIYKITNLGDFDYEIGSYKSWFNSVSEDIEESERHDIVLAEFFPNDNALYLNQSPGFKIDPKSSITIKKLMKHVGANRVMYVDGEEDVEVHSFEIKGEVPDYAYHGTNSTYLLKLLRIGIRPRKDTDASSNYARQQVHHYDHIFFTTHLNAAMGHASNSSSQHGGLPIVIEFKIPDKNLVIPDYDVENISDITKSKSNKDTRYPHVYREPIETKSEFGPERLSQEVGVYGYQGAVPPKYFISVYVSEDPESYSTDGLEEFNLSNKQSIAQLFQYISHITGEYEENPYEDYLYDEDDITQAVDELNDRADAEVEEDDIDDYKDSVQYLSNEIEETYGIPAHIIFYKWLEKYGDQIKEERRTPYAIGSRPNSYQDDLEPDPNDEYQTPYMESNKVDMLELKEMIKIIAERADSTLGMSIKEAYPEITSDIKEKNFGQLYERLSLVEKGDIFKDRTGIPNYDNYLDDPSYAAKKGLKLEVVDMRPMQYLRNTAKGFGITDMEQEKFLQKENMAKYADLMYSGNKFDMPYIDYSLMRGKNDGRIRQEGRHRAFAAYLLGAITIPVLVVTRNDQLVEETEVSRFEESLINFGVSEKAIYQEVVSYLQHLTEISPDYINSIEVPRYPEDAEDEYKKALNKYDDVAAFSWKSVMFFLNKDSEMEQAIDSTATRLLMQIKEILSEVESDDNINMLSNLEHADKNEILAGIRESFESGELDWVIFYIAILKIKTDQEKTLPRRFSSKMLQQNGMREEVNLESLMMTEEDYLTEGFSDIWKKIKKGIVVSVIIGTMAGGSAGAYHFPSPLDMNDMKQVVKNMDPEVRDEIRDEVRDRSQVLENTVREIISGQMTDSDQLFSLAEELSGGDQETYENIIRLFQSAIQTRRSNVG
jgi:hypothetical protein